VEPQENRSLSEDLSKVEDDPQRRLGFELTADDPSLGWREEEKDAHTLQQATFRFKGSQQRKPNDN
jgi:hypothetical protein